MDIFQTLIFALIQGATEFLPVSSSGHLAALNVGLGWSKDGIITHIIAVHFGTVFAVMGYFWRDMLRLGKGAIGLLSLQKNPDTALVFFVILATLPLVATGFFLIVYLDAILENMLVMGYSFIVFGLILWGADRFCLRDKTLADFSPRTALFVGFAQIFALIPGASRAGVTITAARLLGINRQDAARFSMLLSIPTILGAVTLALSKNATLESAPPLGEMLLAAFFAFLAGIIAIAGMMALIRRTGFGIFVLYRLGLGAVLLYWAYMG